MKTTCEQMQLLGSRNSFELDHNMTISKAGCRDTSSYRHVRRTSDKAGCHFDWTSLCFNLSVYMHTFFEDFSLCDRLHVSAAKHFMPSKLAVNESIMELQRCMDGKLGNETMTNGYISNIKLSHLDLLQPFSKRSTTDKPITVKISVSATEDMDAIPVITGKDGKRDVKSFACGEMIIGSAKKQFDCTFWNQTGLV